MVDLQRCLVGVWLLALLGNADGSSSSSASSAASGSSMSSQSSSSSGSSMSSHSSSGGHSSSHSLTLEDLEDVKLFVGAILFFSFLYFMTNQKFVSGMTRAKTWGWLTTTLSIFIAVLVWAGINFVVILDAKADMEKAGETPQTIAIYLWLYALIAVLFFLAIYVTIVSLTPPYLEDYIPNVLGFVTVWAHVVGFALMNHISYCQDYFVERWAEGAASVFGVSMGVWAFYLLLSYGILYAIGKALLAYCVTEEAIHGEALYDREDDEVHIEPPYHVMKAHIHEFTIEVVALAMSYTMVRAICAAITGTLPVVFQTTGGEKSGGQIALLYSFAVGCTIIAAMVHSYENDIATRFPIIGHLGTIFMTTFLTFLTAFSYLQAGRWAVYTTNMDNQHNLYRHIDMAMWTSYLGLAFNLIHCKGLQSRFLMEVAKVFAVIAAFTWELSLDIMLEQASALNKVSHISHLWDSLFILVLIIFLTPMFMFGVYPTTHVCRKDSTQNQLLQQLREGQEHEDEEEDDDLFEELVSEKGSSRSLVMTSR